MKKTICIVWSLLTLALFSCKKENKTPAPANNVTNGNNTNASVTNGLPPSVNSVNGVFVAQKVYYPALNFTAYNAYAGLRATAAPLSGMNPYLNIVVGNDYGDTVKINSTALKFDTTNPASMYIYNDTTTADYSAGVNWYLRGNGNFVSFNTPVTRGFPAATNPMIIPDTISKSQGFILPLSAAGISNADSVSVVVTDPASGYFAGKTVGPNTGAVAFTAAELNNAPTGSANSRIFIYIKNYSHLPVNGKTHVFIMYYDLAGLVTINP